METAGYCCLDAPYERFGNSWGNEYTCELGESSCQNKAPTLAGFSQESCKVYSGTWCAYPRNCSSLAACVANELTWAEENEKSAYNDYLADAPVIEDPMSRDECGSVREYFGFDADFPDDEELCEDIQLLRYNRGFDNLDGFGGTSISTDPIGDDSDVVDSDNVDTADADDVSDGGETMPILQPEDPAISSSAFDSLDRVLYQFEQSLSSLEEAFDVAADFECPEDITGAVKSTCAGIKNTVVGIVTVAFYVSRRVFTGLENSYPGISDYEKYEIYQHALKVVDNMKVLNNGVVQLKMQNAHNAGAIITANGVNTETIVDANAANTRAILDSNVEATDVLIEKIEEACASSPEPGARRVRQLLLPECDSAEAVVSCGFDAAHNSSDKRTLFVEEDGGMIDSGLFYTVKNACSDSTPVKVTVLSNELEEKPTAIIAKESNEELSSEDIKIYLKPSKCSTDSTEFCVSNGKADDTRIYSIKVSVITGAGNAASSMDTCRVIVMPKGSELRRGNASARRLRQEEEEGEETPVASSSSNQFIIAEMLSQSKVVQD